MALELKRFNPLIFTNKTEPMQLNRIQFDLRDVIRELQEQVIKLREEIEVLKNGR